MKKLFFIGVITAMSLTLTSCSSTKPLYSWYDYENSAYAYNKEPSEKLQIKVLEEYKKITEKQKDTRGVVPPGMYAEYGYLLYKTGKKQEGIDFMKKEISLYPESEKYISRIINQLEK